MATENLVGTNLISLIARANDYKLGVTPVMDFIEAIAAGSVASSQIGAWWGLSSGVQIDLDIWATKDLKKIRVALWGFTHRKIDEAQLQTFIGVTVQLVDDFTVSNLGGGQ